MLLMEIRRYARIFKQAVANRFADYAVSRADFVTYLAGKLLRMGFFVLLAISLFAHTKTIVGYTKGEVLMFFAVMNMIDVLTQAIWYRGLHSLKDHIRRGKFDQFLVQPVWPLFKVTAMQVDLFDVITIPVAVAYIVFAWRLLPTAPDVTTAIIALGLFCLSLILAFSINLCMASLSFWTTENESAWALYRDSIYVARFPPEIFPRSIRTVFTFAIPMLGIVAFPAKTLMGLMSPAILLLAIPITSLWLVMSLALWRAGLRHYTSAGG